MKKEGQAVAEVKWKENRDFIQSRNWKMVTFGTKKDVSLYKCLVGNVGPGRREGMGTAGEVAKVTVPDSGDRASASGRKDKGWWKSSMNKICCLGTLFLEHLSPKTVILWRLFQGSSGTQAIIDYCLSMWVLWHCQWRLWADQGSLLELRMMGKEKLLVVSSNLLVKGKQPERNSGSCGSMLGCVVGRHLSSKGKGKFQWPKKSKCYSCF